MLLAGNTDAHRQRLLLQAHLLHRNERNVREGGKALVAQRHVLLQKQVVHGEAERASLTAKPSWDALDNIADGVVLKVEVVHNEAVNGAGGYAHTWAGLTAHLGKNAVARLRLPQFRTTEDEQRGHHRRDDRREGDKENFLQRELHG